MAAQAGGGPAAALAPIFLGALAGFVWFNLPRARLFLGDVGSLPIGLIGGALILDLAQHGAFAAAVILPLYHFTDATTTLLGRMARRERVFEPHRQHAYQHAVDGGWSHGRVSGIVLALNLVLIGLALATLGRGWLAQAALVALALALVTAVILLFRRQGRGRARCRDMKIILTGGSGFLGQALAARLRASGHQLVLPLRNPGEIRDAVAIRRSSR